MDSQTRSRRMLKLCLDESLLLSHCEQIAILTVTWIVLDTHKQVGLERISYQLLAVYIETVLLHV